MAYASKLECVQSLKSELEHMSNLYYGAAKRLKCLSYLPRILADKDYEARRIKEKLAEYEYRYHQVYSNYTDLQRMLSTHDLCPGCGRKSDVLLSSTGDCKNKVLASQQRNINKLSTDCDDQSHHYRLQNQLFNIPEVSKRNFDRLVEENAKLKTAITKMKDKGFDVEHFMTVQEYENVIGGLREYTLRLKLELEEVKYMNSILSKKDRTLLAQKCQQLQKQVTLLSNGLKARDETIDQLMKIIKENEGKIQHGEEPGFTVSSTGITQIEDITSVKGEGGTREKILDYENKISELEQQVAELKMSLTREREMNSILEKHKPLLASTTASLVDREQCPESVHQILCEKKSLQDTVNVLRHDLEKVLDEKELCVEQCKLFHEEFQQEVAKNKKEKEQLQAEITKLKEKNKLLQKSSLSSVNTFDSGYGSSVASHDSSELTCDRCEQKFNVYDQSKYKEHVSKCLAD